MNMIGTQRFTDGCTGKKTFVMGIINITDDSFYDASRCLSEKQLEEKVNSFIAQGVDVLDVGACSTRPGAEPVSEEAEMSRIAFALEFVTSKFPNLRLSVDTFRGNVAKFALEKKNDVIVNDVYAFDKDENMLGVLSDYKPTYVLTHYGNVSETSDFMREIIEFFEKKISILHGREVFDIIIDPGYGFGKTMRQNFELLKRQSELKHFGLPILAGLSRKRMVWQSLQITPQEALNGTTVLNTIAVRNGADILRVHDVKEAKEVAELCGLVN